MTVVIDTSTFKAGSASVASYSKSANPLVAAMTASIINEMNSPSSQSYTVNATNDVALKLTSNIAVKDTSKGIV